MKKPTPSYYFFGWRNTKWFLRELRDIYTARQSYFSKKRIESSVAFIIGQWGMILFLMENHTEMTASDIAIWAGIEFAIAGYIVNQIQKEKTALEEEPQPDSCPECNQTLEEPEICSTCNRPI